MLLPMPMLLVRVLALCLLDGVVPLVLLLPPPPLRLLPLQHPRVQLHNASTWW